MIDLERFDAFVNVQALVQDVLDHRNQMLTELVKQAQKIIALYKHSPNLQTTTSFRMADFALFALNIAEAHGMLKMVEELFRKISSQQSAFTLEDDPIAFAISTWADDNLGKEVSYKQLFDELIDQYNKKGVMFPFRPEDQAKFSQHLRNILDNLRSEYSIALRKGHSRINYITFLSKV